MQFSTHPSYNIKVVLQETGLKADALRVWEKRYGLPNPSRSEGGHRLYSEYDIEVVKWLLAKKSEGLTISKAVKLFREKESAGDNPLAQHAENSSTEFEAGKQIEEFRSDWIEACKAFNEVKAERLLSQAFAIYPTEIVGTEVMQKGLNEIGKAWFDNKITIAQEHFASHVAIRKLNAIISAATAPSRKEKILIACPPNEDHIFSALMINLVLRNQGWDIVFLGANVPIDELEKVIQKSQPAAAILIAMQLNTAASLQEMSAYLNERGVAVGFGGLAFQRSEGLAELIPGTYLGDDLKEAGSRVEALIRTEAEKRIATANPLFNLHTAFKEKRRTIESDVYKALSSEPEAREFFTIGNKHLGQDILAATQLGNLDFLKYEIDWVKKLLSKRKIPIQMFITYLQEYQKQVSNHLDNQGQSLADWLSASVKQLTD